MSALRQFADFLRHLAGSREVLWSMVHRDFRVRYLGSVLGFLWAFIQPLATLGVLWLVFEVGFKAQAVRSLSGGSDVPFVLWLAAGMLPWLFFSEALARASGSVIEHNFLVKQVVFRTSLLPLVSLGSALLVHLCLMVLLAGIFGATGLLGWHLLQLPYYMLATLVLLLGLSWITASLSVFLRDVPHLIALGLQFGFWLTPIFWDFERVMERHPGLALLFKLNPLFYVVRGYRDSLFDGTWFWQRGYTNLFFWAFVGITFPLGAMLFRRLRPHFADVL